MQMEYMPMHALSREPKTVMNYLRRDGELVVTHNGRPTFLMIDLSNRDLVSTVNLLREGSGKPADSDVEVSKTTKSQRQSAALTRMLSAFSQIENEPLDEEFDRIVNTRVNISRDIDI